MKVKIKNDKDKEEVEMNLFLKYYGTNQVALMATDQLGKEWVIETIDNRGIRLWYGLPEYFPVNKDEGGTIKIVE